jgi:tetratricopeptide (TPR) repeat protein
MSVGTEFAFDYFISRRGSAADIAVEVADVLEHSGFRVKIQDHDFSRGGDFIGDIHDALVSARHLFVLHTADYDENYWTRKEFTNFLACLPESQGTRRICMLRCDASMPRGILANVVFGDITNVVDAEQRSQIILSTAKGAPLSARREPPVFGGSMPKKNSNFTGREQIIAKITSLARGDPGSMALVVVAICGLAGTGKTSLARACVDALAEEYAVVWWINARTRQDIMAGLAALGMRLDPTAQQEADVEKAARAVLLRIERSERPFLLMFDNVEHPGDIDDLLPARGAHVLVTSRRTDWHGRAHEVAVDVMDEDEAVSFLQARSGRKDEAGARRLAHRLGFLPLALDHAGAYVRLSMSSFDSYIKGIDKLLAKAPKDASYPASVAATFSLAIESAIGESAAADVALGQLAFFAPEKIPLELLPEQLLEEDDRGDALMALTGVSLIRSDPLDDDTPGISVHRLVQAAARLRLAAQGNTDTALERAIGAVQNIFPAAAYEDPGTWPRCSELLPHAMAIREQITSINFKSPVAPILFDRVGLYLHGRAVFPLAEQVFRDAIAMGERVFGADSLEVARSRNNLANILYAVGRRQEAEPLFRESLAVQEKQLGRSDPGCARTMTSLSWLLHELGRPVEAEELLREAIASGETVLGRNHPDVAVRINNLALMLLRSSRLDEAESLLREAIKAGEQSVGRDHQMVLARLNNLAHLLQSKGQGVEAEALFREAIDSGMRSLGHDHPDLAVWRNNLGNLLRDQSRYGDAEPLYREALSTCEQKYGLRHPMTGRVQRNLAMLHLATQRNEDALREANSALAVHDEMLGSAHQWTRDSAECCAHALDRVGRPIEADAVRLKYGLVGSQDKAQLQ